MPVMLNATSCCGRHRGIVAVELVVALVLSVIVLSLIAMTMIAQSRLARAVGERIAYNDAARATLHILPAELRLSSANDIRAASTDSVSGRWVRSSGVICASQPPDVWLQLRGIRDPDVSKDSLLTISDSGESVTHMSSLTRDASRCSPVAGEDGYRVRVSGTAPAAGVVMIFETGNYYLSQRALRYRVGGEGRQPLTEEYLRDGSSSLEYMASDSVSRASFRIRVALKTQMQHSAGRTIEEAFFMPNAAVK